MERGIGIKSYKKKVVVFLYFRCGCGKYNKGSKFMGVICDLCGVEVRKEAKINIPREILKYYLGF